MENGQWKMDNCQLLTVNSQLKKDYKRTEVGIIPSDWVIKPLGEIVYFLDGKRRPIKDNDRAKMRGQYPYYGASGVIDFVNDYIFDEELILLGEDGENILSRNVRLAFKISGKVWVNNHAHVLKPKEAFDINYLTEKLESINYEQYNTGTAQPKLNQRTCWTIPVALPPTKAEQTAIATALSDADALISSLEKLIAKKRNIKQGAMQQLLTGKKRLPGFSGKWEVKKLGEIAHINPENLGSDTSPNYSFRYISLEDVDYGTLRGHTEQVFCIAPSRARRKVRKGDVLVSTVRRNLKSHLLIRDDVVDTVCSTGFSVVRYKPTLADPAFIFAHLFAGSLERQIESLLTGSNYLAINSSDVKTLRIPCPSLPEQTAIAQILSDMGAEIEALKKKLEKYKMIKQGMMQELLTGKTRLV